MPTNQLNKFFHFSRSEKNSILALAILVFITWSSAFLINKSSTTKWGNDLAIKEEIKQFESSLEPKTKEYTPDNRITMSEFDPNTYTIEDWEKIGFTRAQSATIVKYKQSIGGFKSKEQLRDVYSVSDENYLRIEPYIRIEVTEINVKQELPATSSGNENKHSEAIKPRLEINVANEQDFKKIPGIGSVLSARIVKYRNLLGHFHHTEQLKEVYGINDDWFSKNHELFYVDTSLIHKKWIHTLSYAELARIPYVNKNITSSIFHYANFTKKEVTVLELNKNGILSDSVYQKLSAYFH